MTLKQLFINNERWAKQCQEKESDYFARLVSIQKPDYLWIGCSDARVPANTIVGLHPGEVFVHRNIANQIQLTDSNIRAVIEFALKELKIRKIIICGHYQCGGVLCSMTGSPYDDVNHWLQDLADKYKNETSLFKDLPTQADQHKKLCELNIKYQISHLMQFDAVQETLKTDPSLVIYGVIYNLGDGLLKPLYTLQNGIFSEVSTS